MQWASDYKKHQSFARQFDKHLVCWYLSPTFSFTPIFPPCKSDEKKTPRKWTKHKLHWSGKNANWEETSGLQNKVEHERKTTKLANYDQVALQNIAAMCSKDEGDDDDWENDVLDDNLGNEEIFMRLLVHHFS